MTNCDDVMAGLEVEFFIKSITLYIFEEQSSIMLWAAIADCKMITPFKINDGFKINP